MRPLLLILLLLIVTNKDIRKVKNDRNHALSIAKLGKFEDIKVSSD